MSLKMKCDNCKLDDLNEVFILRKENFTEKGEQFNKCSRVCWNCARRFVLKGIYEIGTSWHHLFLDFARRTA